MSAYQQNVQSVGVVTVALGILLFSASAMAGTTGEVLHVDSGYHVVGMKRADAPDISTV